MKSINSDFDSDNDPAITLNLVHVNFLSFSFVSEQHMN